MRRLASFAQLSPAAIAALQRLPQRPSYSSMSSSSCSSNSSSRRTQPVKSRTDEVSARENRATPLRVADMGKRTSLPHLNSPSTDRRAYLHRLAQTSPSHKGRSWVSATTTSTADGGPSSSFEVLTTPFRQQASCTPFSGPHSHHSSGSLPVLQRQATATQRRATSTCNIVHGRSSLPGSAVDPLAGDWDMLIQQHAMHHATFAPQSEWGAERHENETDAVMHIRNTSSHQLRKSSSMASNLSIQRVQLSIGQASRLKSAQWRLDTSGQGTAHTRAQGCSSSSSVRTSTCGNELPLRTPRDLDWHCGGLLSGEAGAAIHPQPLDGRSKTMPLMPAADACAETISNDLVAGSASCGMLLLIKRLLSPHQNDA